MSPSYYRSTTPTPFPVLAGLLRLSSKYAVDDIRSEVIAHFSRKYPSTLEEYTATLEPTFLSKIAIPPEANFLHLGFDFLRLAREASAHFLLPGVFLELSRFRTEAILSAATDPRDGPARLHDVMQCVKGREALVADTRRRVLEFVDAPSPASCQSSARCRHNKREQCGIGATWNFFTEYYRGFLPTDKIVAYWANFVCAVCLDAFKVSVEARRRELWAELPEYFGLPSWEDLKRRE